ncbi:MAG TPA: N-acetylmuramoyl-L-alanine amidase [Thermoanaerobaculia bacterium]|nr:N-acetylmuramoyl-L-alanine amidase [Thermoanaerobaculia bacterium]
MVCKWRVAILGAVVMAGALHAGVARQAPVGAHMTARLEEDQELVLLVEPQSGDAWTRLALRITGNAAHWRELARLNGQGENLLAGRLVRVPFAMLREGLQLEAARALFPADEMRSGGWRHRVVEGIGVEGESLWKIAEWFTGDGANYARIREANPGQALSTRRGTWVTIPAELLAPAFRSVEPLPRIAEDDPIAAADRTVESAAEITAPADANIQLEYRRSGERPYAVYRLQQGEALYSSVGIRFTGRVYAKDVNEVVGQIVEFNDIRDVSKIPVNYPVKIPMELLTAEWRPADDPMRVARERTQRESARLASRVSGSASLSGVHIIIDPGHGGRDVGTDHEGVWESTYVYDVACRLQQTLESLTEAKVSLTTISKSRGCRVPERDVLEPIRDHEVLTRPKYELADPVVGVNLRWYLANSLYRRSIAATIAPERVIFISIHADSLHPSLRGAMAYVPGERHVRGSYTRSEQIYLARAEVRENPTVTHSAEEALLAEGLSTRLAASVIDSFRSSGLKVHPFQPVRDNVVRNGREWVPAVIRYNKVPARILLEVCNLGNPEDRRLIQTRTYRQDLAESIRDGIVEFFRGEKPEAGSLRTAAR